MAPSFDCMLNLFCVDEPTESIWDDEVVSHNDEECAPQEPSHSPIPHFPVEENEVIAVLIEKEAGYMPKEDYLGRFSSLAGLRCDAIGWILKVQARYHFGHLTAYLAVNYLDRFLSSDQLLQGKDWMLQLLSVACVSLAAKMEEPEVPLLLDLQLGQGKYVFEARTIQRMELLILSILKWRLSSVTPFSYVGYLLHKIGMRVPFPTALVLRVTELIFATCRMMEFLLHRPSVIAIASVICACQEFCAGEANNYKELLLCALPVSDELSVKCYEKMQELVIDPFWTSKKASTAAGVWGRKKRSSISSMSAPQSPVGVLDAAAAAARFTCSMDSESGKTRSGEWSAGMDKHTKMSMTAATAAAAPPPPAPARTTTTRISKRKFAEV